MRDAEPAPELLYHYTTAEFADEVITDINAGLSVHAEIWDGLYGPGFYALDLAPDAASREHLRYECFGDSRAEHPMDGVLVIESALAVPPFVHQERHIWLMPGDAGTAEPIDHMIVAVGFWEHGTWHIDPI